MGRATQPEDMFRSEVKVEGRRPSTGFQFPEERTRKEMAGVGLGWGVFFLLKLQDLDLGPQGLNDLSDAQHPPNPHLETATQGMGWDWGPDTLNNVVQQPSSGEWARTISLPPESIFGDMTLMMSSYKPWQPIPHQSGDWNRGISPAILSLRTVMDHHHQTSLGHL